MKRLLPSPAMGVALLALLVALGGTTYAATKIKKNAVGSKQLQANAVKTAKIAANAVTTAKLAGDAVTTDKLAANAVTSAKVADGTLTRSDAAQGVLVTAYGRINNTIGSDPAIAPGSVNITDLDVIGADGTGNLIVTFNGLPNNTLAGCSIVGQPVVSPSTLAALNRRTVAIATGGGSLADSSAQVTMLDAAATPFDGDFFVQVSCSAG
jgi:hypothetical protein